MKPGSILRLALLGALAAGMIATVVQPRAAMPNPGDAFYEDALCVHQPRKASVAASGAPGAGDGT